MKPTKCLRMNWKEKRALKRALESQSKWKIKAKARHSELRQQKLTIRDLRRSRALWKERYSQMAEDAKSIKKEKKAIARSSKVTKKQKRDEGKKN